MDKFELLFLLLQLMFWYCRYSESVIGDILYCNCLNLQSRLHLCCVWQVDNSSWVNVCHNVSSYLNLRGDRETKFSVTDWVLVHACLCGQKKWVLRKPKQSSSSSAFIPTMHTGNLACDIFVTLQGYACRQLDNCWSTCTPPYCRCSNTFHTDFSSF